MTSDDQQFLDLLASIPQDMAAYGGRIADYIEKHTNSIASDIRDAIDQATWLPESFKPPRNSPQHFFARAPPPPQGVYEKTVAFISKNRTIIAATIAFAGTTAYLVHRRKRANARKRRAKKLPNGAKKEIVVLACSTFHDPLTRSLAVDLERRGYVVYVTVSSTEEDSLVQQEAKPDLRPLWIDLTSTVANPAYDTHPDLDPIRELLTAGSRSVSPSSRRQSSGVKPYEMTLAGIIVFPGSSGYPTGPLALLHPSDVVDSVNTRLLSPLLTVQQFLPLLARHSIDPKSPATIIIAYPSIPQSLTPPAEVPGTIISSSLSALASSLRRELQVSSANVIVSELKLGNFDLGSVYSKSTNRAAVADYHSHPHSNSRHPTTRSTTHSPSTALTHWHSSQRAAEQRSRFGQSSLIRGSAAREFHNAVFDLLAPPPLYRPFNSTFEWQSTKRSQIVFVGSGAKIYDVLGKILPSSLVGLMMGYRVRRDTCLLPRCTREKVVGDELEDGEGIGLVRTKSGNEVFMSDEEKSLVWGRAGQPEAEIRAENVDESAVWEKV